MGNDSFVDMTEDEPEVENKTEEIEIVEKIKKKKKD